MSIRNLDNLLRPESVALIGASKRSGSLGGIIWNNLKSAGFLGSLFAVNLKYSHIGGTPVFKSVSDIPEVIDLAIICTPPATVVDLITELGLAKVKSVIVITAGLSFAQKQAMLSAAKPHLLRVLGPNCLGLISPKIRLNASFSQTNSVVGDLAFISQSGAVATAVLDWAKFRGIGFSHLISVGESSDIDFADLLDVLGSDSSTKAIILYIESIQNARKFMSAARAAARNKPVIVLKAGRSPQGAIAAASHSGALAGSDLVFDAAISRAGMLRVDTLQEMFTAVMALTHRNIGQNDRLTILTNGGGAGVIAADCAARQAVELTSLEPVVITALDQFLPSTWSKSNPVDIIGDAPINRYVQSLEYLLKSNNDSSILLIHAPTAMVSSTAIAKECVLTIDTAKDRVIGCWLGDESVREAREIFRQAGIADYATPEEAIAAFGMLQTYRHHQELLMQVPPVRAMPSKPDLSVIRKSIDDTLAANRFWLSIADVNQLLNLYGISTPKLRRAVASRNAVLAAGAEVGYPLALKIDSEHIQHKIDVGGVKLNIKNAQDLGIAYELMVASLHKNLPLVSLEHFILQAMVEKPNTIELIVGSTVDSLFGPVIVFGQGGTSVEITKDRAIGIPPLNSILANELMFRTQISKQFVAYRGKEPVNTASISNAIVALSAILADIPEIVEMDINPLCVDAIGAIALDARIRLAIPSSGGLTRFAILPYPDELTESLVWRDETIFLRPIRPEDETQHRQFLEQLTPEDIRMRVFFSKRQLARSELARLTQIDYAREMAFIAERVLTDGTSETLATVRLISDPEGYSAEFAIVVRSDLKRLGLGKLMLNKAIVYAKEKGLKQLVGTILRDNIAMQHLATQSGFITDRSIEMKGSASNIILML
jgi:acetyltransferase